MAPLLAVGILRFAPKRAVLALVAVAALVTVLGTSQMAFADGEELKIVSQNVVSDFPDGVIFRVTAAGPDPVDEIRVFLKPKGGDRSTYGYLDIEPGTEVSGEYVMPTDSTATHTPPGALIQYSYEVRDTAGRVLRTEEQEFLYMDETLEWRQISEGILTVYYYGEFVEKRARTVLETAQKTMDRMGRVLGVQTTEPIRIVAYSNYRDMIRGLPFRSQAVSEGLQTQGQAWPSERVLLVLSSEATVTGIASHEFTHILVGEAAGRGYSLVPAWLNEGLAEYGNIDQTPAYDRALAYAVFTRRLKPLWFQQSLGGEPDDIVIGYGQGKSVVNFLIGNLGPGKMAELMTAFHTATSVDDALMQTYGFDQHGLDSLWRQSLGLEPLPSPDELARQLEITPSPSPESEESATTEAVTPTALAEETPPAAPTDESPVASDEDREERGTSRSCGNSPGSVSVAMVAMFGVPLLALRPRWGTAAFGRPPVSRLVRVFPGRRRVRD